MHSAREILKAVRRIEIATKRAVNAELAGRYHSVFKGQGMSFSEVRPYTPGDDIRHIDWNVSARAQGIFVKQFVEERELTVMLLVDLSASGGFATRGKMKRNVLAEVGALIAFSAIKNHDRVGLVLFTEGVELFLPPRKGKKHVLRVIREIFEVEPKARGTSIGEALAFLSRVQKRRSVCFVLSDFIDRGYEPALKVAMARHDVVAARIADPAEQELPNLGLLELVDAETGRVQLVDSSSKKVREAYRVSRRRERDETKKRFHQLGLDLVDLSTDGDFVTPLVEFFRLRSTRVRAGR
jgi:uncharacterized protein (DUF58 family)